jgi:hypothetical protein
VVILSKLFCWVQVCNLGPENISRLKNERMPILRFETGVVGFEMNAGVENGWLVKGT